MDTKTPQKRSPFLIIFFIVIAVVLVSIRLYNRHTGTTANNNQQADTTSIITPPVDTLPYLTQPVEKKILPDSTRIFILKGSTVTPAGNFPNPRQVSADGDLFFDIPAGKRPFIVRTSLLVLTATGHCTFRVIAYSKDGGEEVQVLDGTVKAEKSYHSDYPEPDTLHGGQMVMINKSIDLMEKEDDDPKELRAWWQKQ